MGLVETFKKEDMTKIKRNPHKARSRRNKIKARVRDYRQRMHPVFKLPQLVSVENFRENGLSHEYVVEKFDKHIKSLIDEGKGSDVLKHDFEYYDITGGRSSLKCQKNDSK